MIRSGHDFSACLVAGSPEDQAVVAAVLDLGAASLPLAGACNHGGMIDPASLRAYHVRSVVEDDRAEIRVDVFFEELIGGCNCNEDPVATMGRAELIVRVDLASGIGEILPG